MDEPDEKIEAQLEVTNSTLRKVNKLMKNMEPIMHDLKEGNLKRVAKTTFTRKARRKLDLDSNRSSSSNADSDAARMAPSRQQRSVTDALESHRSAGQKKHPSMSMSMQQMGTWTGNRLLTEDLSMNH